MTLLWFSQTAGLNGGRSGAFALVPGIQDQSHEPGVGAPGCPEGPDGAGGAGSAGGSWAKKLSATRPL